MSFNFKTKLSLILICMLSFAFADARIRNRKVKEAPRVCQLMKEDLYLTRGGKKVYGTLRHSLIFESFEEGGTVSLVKDKGEKICQWTADQWGQVLNSNQAEDLSGFKYHIDEYKEILYPYAQKADSSFFMLSIPLATCSLENQSTTAQLSLPKCEIPKKAKSKKRKKTVKKKQ